VVSALGKRLERFDGFRRGDGVKDSSVYVDDHALVVDVVGTDVGSPAFVVRALNARTNAPSEIFRVDKDGSFSGASDTFRVRPTSPSTVASLVVQNAANPNQAGTLTMRMNGATASIFTGQTGAAAEPTAFVLGAAIGNVMVITTATGVTQFNYPLQVTNTTTNDTLLLQNNDAGSLGVLIGCLANSASPDNNDTILRISGRGNDSNGNNTSYGYMSVYIQDPTDGSEDAYFMFTCQLAGTANDTLMINPTGSIFYKGGLSLAEGNLAFSTTTQRITADMSNANHPFRLGFQSSTANGETTLTFVPNGSSTVAGVKMYGAAGAANCAALAVTVSGNNGIIDQNTVGSGTQGSLVLRVAGTTIVSLGSGGQLGFFTSGGTTKPTVTGSRGGNAALASLLTALAGFGLLTDSSS